MTHRPSSAQFFHTFGEGEGGGDFFTKFQDSAKEQCRSARIFRIPKKIEFGKLLDSGLQPAGMTNKKCLDCSMVFSVFICVNLRPNNFEDGNEK